MTASPGAPKPRRWPLIAAAACVLALMWGVRRWQRSRLYRSDAEAARAEADQVLPVKGYKVRPRDVSGALRRIGTIRARAETNLQFGAPGRLQRFDVEKGQFVKKGAVIALLNQEEARNLLTAAELEFQRTSTKYFKDRTVDKVDYDRAKARYAQARLEAAKTSLVAPHDGYLVEKWVSAGEQVEPGSVVGKLMDKSRVSVEMDLSEDDIQYLKAGQKVSVTVDAVPDFKEQGEVLSITPYLKGDSRSFNVKVGLSTNPDEKLNPGMFARCVIRRYEKTGAIVIPLDAAAEMREKEVKVFVIGDDNVARAKVLPKEFTDESLIEVRDLPVDSVVMLHPGTDLQDGAKVHLTGVYNPDSEGKLSGAESAQEAKTADPVPPK